MTVLMVTPYAPYRDGIAAYAVQEVRAMRAAGVDVEVLSPLPSAAHHHLALGGMRGMAALARRAANYESVILQFSPEMIFGACRTPVQRVGVWSGLMALARVTTLEIRLHEIEYGPLDRNPVERAMAASALRAAASITVHTGREVEELSRQIGLDPSLVTLVDHGASFAPATDVGRREARIELGLDFHEHVFLAIGFLQEHKGFDRAVEAFGRAELSDRASLHIVGSVRVDHPDLISYAQRLQGLCAATAGATLHRKYVSDEEFDRWIVAADTIVLPYREIWSSGVMERAKLHQRPVIATDVGGMGDQASEGTLFFTDADTLVKAFRERASAHQPEVGSSGRANTADTSAGPGSDPEDGVSGRRSWSVDRLKPDRVEVEAQIRARARTRRLAEEAAIGPVGAAVDPLLAIGSLQRPHAVSARPGVSEVKRMLRRVLGWEIDPLAAHIEALQRATIEAITRLEAHEEDRSR